MSGETHPSAGGLSCQPCTTALSFTTERVHPSFLQDENKHGGKTSFLAGTGGILKSSRKREFKELGRECERRGRDGQKAECINMEQTSAKSADQ